MKENMHPKVRSNSLYYSVGSSASHPFYTGKQRVMDTEGRIDRFNKRYSKPAAK